MLFETRETLNPGCTEETLYVGGQAIIDRIRLPDGQQLIRKMPRMPNWDPDTEEYKLAINRFQREITLLSSLDNPYIVKIIEPGKYGYENVELRLPCYFMSCAEQNLEKAIEEDCWIKKPSQTIGYILCVLIGLAYLHKKQVTHRDIKPKNILLYQNGVICLADFGLSKGGDSEIGDLTKLGVNGVTQFYVAPEQAQNLTSANPCSDIYSFGATLFNIFTRKTYLSTNSSSIENEEMIPGWVRPFLAKCLAFSPDDRYIDGSNCLTGFVKAVINQASSEGLTISANLSVLCEGILKNAEAGEFGAFQLLLPTYKKMFENEPSSSHNGLSWISKTASGNAISQIFKTRDTAQHFLELVEFFDVNQKPLNTTFVFADEVADFYSSLLKTLFKSENIYSIRNTAADQYLSDSLLSEVFVKHRFDAARTYLGSFIDDSDRGYEVLCNSLKSNDKAADFLKNEVDVRWLGLPERIRDKIL